MSVLRTSAACFLSRQGEAHAYPFGFRRVWVSVCWFTDFLSIPFAVNRERNNGIGFFLPAGLGGCFANERVSQPYRRKNFLFRFVRLAAAGHSYSRNRTSVVSSRTPPQRSPGVLIRMSQSTTKMFPSSERITFSS